MIDKPLPSNIDAERAALGAILLDREAIVPIETWLLPEHFYLEAHARIYEAMLACYRRQVPPDASTISDELRRQGRLDQVGGLLYLVDLANHVPTAVHVEYYAETVERTALLRRLIMSGGKIAALGFDESREIDEVLDEAEQEIFAVTQRRASDSFVNLSQLADQEYVRLQRLREGEILPTGIPSGFADLDEVTGGFFPGELTVVAARPATGKTSLLLSLALNLISEQVKVGVFSLEMGRDVLMLRIQSMLTSIPMQRIRTGDIRDKDLLKLMEALGKISDKPLYIEDKAGITISDLRKKARRMHASVGLDVLFVDYLQLLKGKGGGKSENRTLEIDEISVGLRELARELKIPIVALAQLSRDVEKRTGNHIPKLADIREGGSIEQTADNVMFIHREELYDKETDRKGIAEIHIAKHRNGPTAVVPLRFDANSSRFYGLDRYISPEGY